MAISISSLHDRHFDVLVVGGGVNGSSSAQHLAAAGYSVLLIEKGDFGSGASSRSSRSLGNGMHYLALGHSPWDFLFDQRRFLSGCSMARAALANRAQFVRETPERLAKIDFAFPIYRDGIYKPWQFDAGVTLLKLLGTGGMPLNYRRLPGVQASKMPLLEWLRDPQAIRSIAMMDHYLFRWPERIVIDTVMDAARLGATVRNYTRAQKLAPGKQKNWSIELVDTLADECAVVEADVVLNMAGAWIDQVNQLAPAKVGRKIMGTKGVHLGLKLPPHCRGSSVTWYNRHNEHMYILPWGEMHYLGPTETVYEGSLDDVHPLEAEIEWIISEANYQLPGLGLKRSDVLYSWAGVRPWTHHPDAPKGLRRRILHDLQTEGLPGVFALTGGPLNSHRSVGQEVCQTVKTVIGPRIQSQHVSYAAKLAHANIAATSLSNEIASPSAADLRSAAQEAMPRNLVDLLFRRVTLGWSADMGVEKARWAAETVSDILGWDEFRIDREVAGYREHVRHFHLARSKFAASSTDTE